MNHWDEDPVYPVANDDTRLGYHAWVEQQRELNEHCPETEIP